jgi:glutathione reductase (NADPH)
MSRFDYDLIVLGAGSGGVRAARVAAQLGARVAIVEANALGGTCVNVGCIPKKLLSYAGEVSSELRDAAGYGWCIGASEFSWPTLIERKNAEIERLNGVYGRLLEQAGVGLVEGRARLVDPHIVEVESERMTAERVLVATGSQPLGLGVPGEEHAITSDQAFYLDELPKRPLVAGGGYIGVEFASIFRGLGADVTLVQRSNQVLRGFDEDIRSFLGEELERRGIDLRCARTIRRIEASGADLTVELSDGQRVEADLVLSAVGRVPNTRGLGLEEVGVELGPRGQVLVDESYRSNVPSVFALGDVIDRLQLTPVAIHEAMAFAHQQFGEGPRGRHRVAYESVPTAVFSHPAVGTVGLSEQQAHHECPNVVVFRTSFRPLKHTLSGSDERTFMKLVVDEDTDRVLGVHLVGPEAGEIIQGFAVAVTCGATKAQLDRTVGVHPTSAEELVTMRTPAPRGGA